jgi:hypothetical protein
MSHSRPAFQLNEILCKDSAWLQELHSPTPSLTHSFTHMDKLLFDNKFTDFMTSSFEKLPCLIRHSMDSQEPQELQEVFSQQLLSGICDNEVIPVQHNMAVRKYTYSHTTSNKSHEDEESHEESRVRDVFEFPESATADSQQLQQLYQDGYTVQFFQPQRFSDALHSVCAGFEYMFGSLAGSSAYLTPAKTQGLAPHWDDVEVFIFQTQGTKLWHLWQGPYLPEDHSSDIERDSEYLQDPPVELLLRPGDILYLPRGTVHEAISQDSFSTHVTISVMQKYNIKGLVEKVLPNLLQKAFDSSATSFTLRQGLPLNLPQNFGSYAGLSGSDYSGSGGSASFASTKAESRKHTLNAVKQTLEALAALVTEEDVDDAADIFNDDFANHRLPPPLSDSETEGNATIIAKIDGARALQTGNMKKLRSALFRICDPKLIHHRVVDMGGAEILFLGSSHENNRRLHMGHPPLPGDEEEDMTLEDMESGSHDENEDEDEGDSEDGSASYDSGLEDEQDENYGMGEGEDAMGWVSLSLPAHVCKIVQVLENCYQNDTNEGSDEYKYCISFADIMAKTSDEKYSEDEVSVRVFTQCG